MYVTSVFTESSTSKSTFYVDSDQETIITLATGGTESTTQPTVTPIMLEKKKKVQPEGTLEYTVCITCLTLSYVHTTNQQQMTSSAAIASKCGEKGLHCYKLQMAH